MSSDRKHRRHDRDHRRNAHHDRDHDRDRESLSTASEAFSDDPVISGGHSNHHGGERDDRRHNDNQQDDDHRGIGSVVYSNEIESSYGSSESYNDRDDLGDKGRDNFSLMTAPDPLA